MIGFYYAHNKRRDLLRLFLGLASWMNDGGGAIFVPLVVSPREISCVMSTQILTLLSESNGFVIWINALGSLLRKGRGWRTAGLS